MTDDTNPNQEIMFPIPDGFPLDWREIQQNAIDEHNNECLKCGRNDTLYTFPHKQPEDLPDEGYSIDNIVLYCAKHTPEEAQNDSHRYDESHDIFNDSPDDSEAFAVKQRESEMDSDSGYVHMVPDDAEESGGSQESSRGGVSTSAADGVTDTREPSRGDGSPGDTGEPTDDSVPTPPPRTVSSPSHSRRKPDTSGWRDTGGSIQVPRTEMVPSNVRSEPRALLCLDDDKYGFGELVFPFFALKLVTGASIAATILVAFSVIIQSVIQSPQAAFGMVGEWLSYWLTTPVAELQLIRNAWVAFAGMYVLHLLARDYVSTYYPWLRKAQSIRVGTPVQQALAGFVLLTASTILLGVGVYSAGYSFGETRLIAWILYMVGGVLSVIGVGDMIVADIRSYRLSVRAFMWESVLRIGVLTVIGMLLLGSNPESIVFMSGVTATTTLLYLSRSFVGRRRCASDGWGRNDTVGMKVWDLVGPRLPARVPLTGWSVSVYTLVKDIVQNNNGRGTHLLVGRRWSLRPGNTYLVEESADTKSE